MNQSFGKIWTLAKLFTRDLIQTRVVASLVAIWLALLIASFGANVVIAKRQIEAREQENAALMAYLETLPGRGTVITNFVTQPRPVPPHYPLVAGVEYAAPDLLDLRFRESPAFYYGDDVDPTSRLFRPLDLPFIVGIAGFLITLLIGHDAINLELENGNARFLSLFGVRLWHIYAAKALVLATFVCGTFALVFPAGLVPVALFGGGYFQLELGRVALLCGLGVAFLLFAVACTCALSTLFRRRATAFLAGAGVFLLMVYVLPNTAVFVGRLTKASDEGAIAEKAQAVARELHKPLDDGAAMAVEAFKTMTNPTTRQIYETMGRAMMKTGGGKFGPLNNERTIALNLAELKRLNDRDKTIMRTAIPVSPFLATTHAMTVVAETSVGDDYRLTTFAADPLQRAFFEWTQSADEELNPQVEHWVFSVAHDSTAKPGRNLDLSSVPHVKRPESTFREAAKEALGFGSITLGYGLLFWVVGLVAARRLGRKERC